MDHRKGWNIAKGPYLPGYPTIARITAEVTPSMIVGTTEHLRFNSIAALSYHLYQAKVFP